MALNSNALVDLNSAKLFVKIPTSVTSQDSLMEGFINEASDLIEKYCNRKFRQKTITEVYDGGRTSEILLHQWPVTNVVNLWEDSEKLFPTETLIDPSDYRIVTDQDQEGISIEKLSGVFARGKGTVKVEYTFGYNDFSDVPSGLALACKRLIGYYFKQQQNEDFTETNKSKGDENVTLIDGIPLAVTNILDNYKRLEMLGYPDPVRNL